MPALGYGKTEGPLAPLAVCPGGEGSDREAPLISLTGQTRGALTPWGKGPDTQRTFIGPGAPASPPGQGLPGPGAYRNALRVSAARDLSDTAEERVGEETSLQIGHFSRRNRALTHY
jgi:hypothetical protein